MIIEEDCLAKNQSSVEKAHAQSDVRHGINRSAKRRIHTASRKANDVLQNGDKETIAAVATETIQVFDKAVARKRMHRNAAARRKSRLMKKVNAAIKA